MKGDSKHNRVRKLSYKMLAFGSSDLVDSLQISRPKSRSLVQETSEESKLNRILNEGSKIISKKRIGKIGSFGVFTSMGISKTSNEDKVTVTLKKKTVDSKQLKVSIFSIFDGHGGSGCSEFLKEKLNKYILESNRFPEDPTEAIHLAFEKVEKKFVKSCRKTGDRSGSCAILAVIIGKEVFIANLGDSRAVLSSNSGRTVTQITTDHKPSLKSESQRIIQAGGKLIQASRNGMVGPVRIVPGRISVSRAIGDVAIKQRKLGGIPNLLSPEPEVFSFKISKKTDFLLLGCDGVFDSLSNEEACSEVWNTFWEHKTQNLHDTTGLAVKRVVARAAMKESLDNLTGVLITFPNGGRLN